MSDTGLDARRAGYAAEQEKHRTIGALLDGSYLPPIFSDAIPAETRAIIPLRKRGEADAAYVHKVRTLDPDGLFSYVVSSLAGQIAGAEDKIERTWSPAEGEDGASGPFGDPETPGDAAYGLWRNADGEGTAWTAFWRRVTTALVAYQECYLWVDGSRSVDLPTGVTPEGEVKTTSVTLPPCVRLVPASAVVGWREIGGIPVEARVREVRYETDSVDATPEAVEVFTTLRLNGWERHERKAGASGEDARGERTEGGEYAYFSDGAKKEPCLPIFHSRLDLDTFIAYLWARRCIARMNLQAGHDAYLALGNAPYLHEASDAPAGTTSDESEVEKGLKAGSNFLRTGASGSLVFVEPSMTAATVTASAVQAKREAFLREAFQQANDAAAQATATEVREQSRQGPDAYLSLLSGEVEGDENRALRLLAQALNAKDAAGWGAARVSRSEDFVAADEAARVDALMEKVFGSDPAPVPLASRVDVVERYCAVHGLTFDRDEATASVEAWQSRQRLTPALPMEEEEEPAEL